MNIQDITTWTVTPDHKARPKNPYSPYLPDSQIYEYNKFESFSKQNVYHCSPSLVAGEYAAEMVELVWQKFDVFNHLWINDGESVDNWINHGFKIRQLIQLKDGLKPISDHYKGEVYYKKYIGELLDIFYHRFYEQYSGNANEVDKKQAFYEWLNEQIKNTTY